MGVRLEASREGVLLPVRARPKARRNAVVGAHDGRLRVAVSQAPEQGKANDAVRAVLAAALGLRKAQLRLVAGATSPSKQFLVTGIALEALRERIDQCLRDLA